MPTARLIGIIIEFIVAGILALLSFRSFKEKGFLFNNAYLYASAEERRTMDKKPWYRQSAIAFCLFSLSCIFTGLHMIFDNKLFLTLEFATIIGAVVYAIVSSVMINKRRNKDDLQ